MFLNAETGAVDVFFFDFLIQQFPGDPGFALGCWLQKFDGDSLRLAECGGLAEKVCTLRCQDKWDW